MDPLSITAAASGLVFSVVRNGRALATVYEKYQDSQRCLFMIQTECTVLAAALSQLQMIFSKVTEPAMSRYPEYILEALDLSLVGCTLTMSVLSKEIDSLVESISDNTAAMSKGKRLKYIWKAESMDELLQQLRGQSSALSLLLKALDSSSIDQILAIVQSGKPTFQKVRSGAESIRRTHPEEHYAESIMDMSIDDNRTIYSLEISESTIEKGPVDSMASQLESTTLAPTTSSSLSGDGLPDGWKTGYSAKYDQWYFINTVTRKSQWQRPTRAASASQDAVSPISMQLPNRKPVSPKPPSVEPHTPVQASQQVPNLPRLTPEPPNFAHDAIDSAPWKLNTDSKFQDALDHLRRDASVPAIAVGIVSTDSPARIYVVGERKRDCQSPVTRADRFYVCSTNIFTSTVLAILVDRKVFRWEETILDLFPSIAIRIHPFHHQTTLSMLAAHCAGLTSDIAQVEDGDLWRYLRRVTVSKGQFAVALSYLGRPPDKTPGSSAEWNWANPTLIALAIEIRTSQSLDSFTKTLILDPLEMYSAGFGHPDAKKNASTPEQPTQPWPHQGSTKQIRSPTDVNWFNPPAMGAATGIHCSAPDFARFVDLHLRGSMKLSTQVLPESAAYLYSPYLDTSYTPGNFWINSRDWAGGDALSTSGRCDGFSMAVWLAPLKGKGYFAIANIDGDVGLDITDRAVYLAIRHAAGEY